MGDPDYGYTAASQFYAQGPRPDHTPPSKAMAGWALGLSLVPCLIGLATSVGLAITVLVRSRDGRDHGKGRAIAALVITGLWALVLAGVVIYELSTRAVRDDDTGDVVASGDVSVLELRVGDCTETLETSDQVSTVRILPCASSHAGEVYAVFDLEGPYTTNDDVDRLSSGGCLARFRDFVGIRPQRSELSVFYYLPVNEQQYDDDKSVTCLLTDETGPLTGSARGSRR